MVRFLLHILRRHTELTTSVRSKEVEGGGGGGSCVMYQPIFKPFEWP